MRLRLFGGKGGVGKTTLSAAAAVGSAESGGAVLVVSTDPAHSLGDALGARLSGEPRRISIRHGVLWAAEADAEGALARWLAPRREALLDLIERGTFLDREDASHLLGLGLPGIDEMTGMLEAVRMARRLDCGELVLDTAPTAHTLRLLSMPATLRGFAALLAHLAEKPRLLAERFGVAGMPGVPTPEDLAVESVAGEAREIDELLRDPARTGFTWVLLPEEMSVAESRDGLTALAFLGIPVTEVAVNRLTPPEAAARCPACGARRAVELAAIETVRRELSVYPPRILPAMEREPRGLAALRRLARALGATSRGEELLEPVPAASQPVRSRRTSAASPPAWLATLAPPGLELLLVGGKGGVGKTTCAAAVALAVAAARPREVVLLLSADPAHSLGDVVEAELGDDERPVLGAPSNLRCREIDPGRALSRWRARFGEATEDVLESLTGLLAARAEEATGDLLGLTPPGLDELAVVDALTDAFPAAPAPAVAGLVVVDTAPTGHALRLLAMPQTALAWDHALLALLLKYREAVAPGELAAELVGLSRSLKRLSALLADAERARFAVATRAAELPRRETLRLLMALDQVGVTPAAVLVNAVPEAGDPRCRRCARAAADAARQVARLRRDLLRRAGRRGETGCAMISTPFAVPPPRGVEALAAWSRTWQESAP